MQVTPVSAIHSLRIRQKPVVAPATSQEAPAASTRFGDMPLPPAHVASAALQKDGYHGAHAQYTTQLLASHQDYPETQLERHLHLQQYESVTAHEQDDHSYTISMTA
ncbi:MAG: hypothetical protein K5905_21625 [Roseibium sp.]|uniref:hypothetical protein n=1 Tax=Roseibium sp. TaxID=1936156 RepID=UPI00261A33AD|nr:hypothetical protein [Roseibium sp.]MCV0428064.1 hypothetical protein [Roseibium sp.]